MGGAVEASSPATSGMPRSSTSTGTEKRSHIRGMATLTRRSEDRTLQQRFSRMLRSIGLEPDRIVGVKKHVSNRSSTNTGTANLGSVWSPITNRQLASAVGLPLRLHLPPSCDDIEDALSAIDRHTLLPVRQLRPTFTPMRCGRSASSREERRCGRFLTFYEDATGSVAGVVDTPGRPDPGLP